MGFFGQYGANVTYVEAHKRVSSSPLSYNQSNLNAQIDIISRIWLQYVHVFKTIIILTIRLWCIEYIYSQELDHEMVRLNTCKYCNESPISIS